MRMHNLKIRGRHNLQTAWGELRHNRSHSCCLSPPLLPPSYSFSAFLVTHSPMLRGCFPSPSPLLGEAGKQICAWARFSCRPVPAPFPAPTLAQHWRRSTLPPYSTWAKVGIRWVILDAWRGSSCKLKYHLRCLSPPLSLSHTSTPPFSQPLPVGLISVRFDCV